MNQNKLTSKDLIGTAIFTVLFYIVYMGVSAILWMSVVLNPFCVAAGMLPCGVVWAYMRVKVPKRLCVQGGFEPELANTLIDAVSGTILLLSTVLAVLCAVVGMLIGKATLKKHFMKAGIV